MNVLNVLHIIIVVILSQIRNCTKCEVQISDEVCPPVSITSESHHLMAWAAEGDKPRHPQPAAPPPPPASPLAPRPAAALFYCLARVRCGEPSR